MTTQIKFGTSGWRAVIAEEFTFANLRRAVNGIARYVASQNPKNPKVIVARDPRFLGETFCTIAAATLAAHGVVPLVIAEPAPTPAISYAVIQARADGAINFEAEIASSDSASVAASCSKKVEAQPLDPRRMYLSRLREIVDLDVIKNAGLRVAFDPLWGAARGYPDALMKEAGVDVATVHDYRDVLFGGHAPEPDDDLLEDLRARMRETKARIGIATDGDADRFGIIDEDGTFFQPNYIIALLFDYLVESRGWKNGVGKSVATTNLINALAKHHKVELHETPVGFKYIGELIKEDEIAIGGEESAGLSIRHHVPEKDGILAGLMCCEMVARRGKTLGKQLQELFVKVGSFYPQRENFRLTPEVKDTFTGKLQSEPREFFGRKVSEVVRTDGLKLVFEDGSWICYRLSGTEPVVRVYSEASNASELSKLSAAAKQWIFE